MAALSSEPGFPDDYLEGVRLMDMSERRADVVNESRIIFRKFILKKAGYSIVEVAEMFSVSPNHIRNEARRKKLRIVKLGRRSIILADSLLQYCSELHEAE